MPTSDFPDIIHVAHNALCAFWPIDTAVIAFDVLESPNHCFTGYLGLVLLQETSILSSNG